MGSQGVAYWNVNVPAAEHTESCPDFLARVNDKDRGILSTPDAEFRLHSWPEVTAMIRANRLEDFQRVPSDLRRYKAFTYDLVRRHGSVAAFILGHRLGWEAPVVPRGRPFEHPDDMRILHNDWPYGIDPRIVHLVVWTKFVLEEDPATGDISDQTRREIENYMAETFYVRIPKSRVSFLFSFLFVLVQRLA